MGGTPFKGVSPNDDARLGHPCAKSRKSHWDFAVLDRLKIESIIENNRQVVQLVEMRTQHLGPEEILIGLRVAFNETLQTKDIANLINELETDIRIELKNAGPIFIEPEITEGN